MFSQQYYVNQSCDHSTHRSGEDGLERRYSYRIHYYGLYKLTWIFITIGVVFDGYLRGIFQQIRIAVEYIKTRFLPYKLNVTNVFQFFSYKCVRKCKFLHRRSRGMSCTWLILFMTFENTITLSQNLNGQFRTLIYGSLRFVQYFLLLSLNLSHHK